MSHLVGRKIFQQPKCSSAILWAWTMNCSEWLLAFSWTMELLYTDPHCIGNKYVWKRMGNQPRKNMLHGSSIHLFIQRQASWRVSVTLSGNWRSTPVCVLILKAAILFPRWKKRCVPFPTAHSSDWLMMHAQEEKECLSKNYFPHLWEEQAVLFFSLDS